MNIQDLLKFAQSLKGIKYTSWNSGSTSENDYPFYINNLPRIKYLKENGTNCAGFINILRHSQGLEIMGDGIYKGGTSTWFKYFKDNNYIVNFDYNKIYPLGSLFIRDFRDNDDQGHLAVLYSYSNLSKFKNSILHANIIHSFYNHNSNNKKERNGYIGITNLGNSHFTGPNIEEGYYDGIVLPENWIVNYSFS